MRPSPSHRPFVARSQTGLTLVLLAVAATLPTPARAHFLWLAAERHQGKPTVRAFLSETPDPDSPALLKHIERTRVTAGNEILSWSRDKDTFKVNLPQPSPQVVDGFCDLGLITRKGESFRLLYTARAQFGPTTGPEPASAEHLRVRLVAVEGRPPVVEVTFNGRAAAGAVVKVFPDEGDTVEKKTDDRGRVDCAGVAEGKAGLLVKWVDTKRGEHEGKPYGEVRYYATLTVGPVSSESKAAAKSAAFAPFALMPEGVNSFGGAVLGNWLYVYGGHTGKMHKYSRETAAKHFRRLNLCDRMTWEELPCGPALQGVTLVSHGGRLYRIGGMSPHNPPGEPRDLVSIADFARFDPESKKWTDLPPLPTPRSTHDAVVVGDKIYVIGGWWMKGGDSNNAVFLDTAVVFDSARAGAEWESLPAPPFRRRALAVGAVDGKVYAIGGLTEDGKVVKSVDIYDPEARTWSRGPDVPGSKRQGFAPSAFGVGGKLYVNGVDGQVLRLSGTGDRWEIAGKLAMPRLTHRLLPGIANDLLAVGGSSAGAPIQLIESIPLGDASHSQSRL